jgi:hypothetical protein
VLPELEQFRRQILALSRHPLLSGLIDGDEIRLSALSVQSTAELLQDDVGYYLLMAAAGLNRTSLRKAAADPEAAVVSPKLRKAFAVQRLLPVRERLGEIVSRSVALRRADMDRRARGTVEQLFRDRLSQEGIPLLMSPPVRQVPGLLIGRRKPDGVYPDPASGEPPLVYLEIKNVRRVADDIQKRLYELAEASLEMKLLYSNLTLHGLNVQSTLDVQNDATLRARMRAQIVQVPPTVIGLFLCASAEAERYRPGAEAFVDRVFFQEEIDECLALLRQITTRA